MLPPDLGQGLGDPVQIQLGASLHELADADIPDLAFVGAGQAKSLLGAAGPILLCDVVVKSGREIVQNSNRLEALAVGLVGPWHGRDACRPVLDAFSGLS